MKQKASITLSRHLFTKIDKAAGERSRSAYIEDVLKSHFEARRKAAIHKRDLEILNRAADQLNAEMEDALKYQADVGEYFSETGRVVPREKTRRRA
jgi:metal-responsive CopG/Arc/MetJ family transcriptional regulator